MTRILQSSWFTALVGALLYLGVTVVLMSPSKFEGAQMAHQGEEKPVKSADDDPSWRFRNPEMEQWVAELKREKEALQLREQQLQELAARLEAERKELNAITQTVYQLQAEFDRNVVRIKDQEVDNLKRQVRVFSNMSVDAVAAVVSEMAEDEAVKILFLMKADQASEVLQTLAGMGRAESKRAAILTEKIRRTLPPEPKTARARAS